MGENVKHTPWTVRPSGDDDALWTVEDTRGAIVFVGMEKNVARLISAAPDLLTVATLFAESLKYLIEIDRKKGDDEGVAMKSITLQSVRAAIAKAEGRP